MQESVKNAGLETAKAEAASANAAPTPAPKAVPPPPPLPPGVTLPPGFKRVVDPVKGTAYFTKGEEGINEDEVPKVEGGAPELPPLPAGGLGPMKTNAWFGKTGNENGI